MVSWTLLAVQLGVLGSLEAHAAGRPLPLGSRKQQTVLALLAVHPGRVVTLDDLVDEMWPEGPPASAVANTRGYAASLRRLFKAAEPGGERLLRQNSGYVLHAGPEELDLLAYEAHVAAARVALRRSDLKSAVADLEKALVLWRGPMLADLRRGPLLAARCAALEQGRLAVAEDLAEARLGLDQVGEAVALLREHVRSHPLRERGRLLLMRALYDSGDVAAALAAYAEGRAALAEQLGIEPGRELNELHRAILNRDAGSDPPPAVAVAVGRSIPAQLPPDVYGFSGRAAELAELDSVLEPTGDQPTAVVISAIAGTAGVGKTAIAVHWAHRVRHQFPDGQLYVNLRGFDPAAPPMSPADAVRGFLDAFGVPPQRISSDLDARVGLYRSLLADRRVLVVLDNARDTEQVRPLLPGAAGCLVVVTSRNQLTGLIAAEGARPLPLDLLTVDEARLLLTRRLGPARVAAEPDAVDEIIERCARLPLALAIAAARGAMHPQMPLGALADGLSEALDALDAGDANLDVRAVFSWSYRTLTEPAARLFRLLGLHPGPDVALPAVASLAGLPVPGVRPLLAELTRAHLVTEQTPGRYTFHDLLRAYAAELAHRDDPEDERRAALQRMFDHYLHTAHAADRLLNPARWDVLTLADPVIGVALVDLVGREQAVVWFSDELRVLRATVAYAAATGFDHHVWQLASALATFLNRSGRWQDWADLAGLGLAAAHRLDDRAGLARTHRSLGLACARQDRYDDAVDHLQRALALFDEVGDELGQAFTHLNASNALERNAAYGASLGHAQQAQRLFEARGHRRGLARTFNIIGWALAHMGEHRRALEHCERAISLNRESGDMYGLATTLDSLGFAQHHLGLHGQAVASYLEALPLYRQVGERYFEAFTLRALGDVHLAHGERHSARDAWLQALNILDELGHRDADQVRTKLAELDDRGELAPS